MTYQGQQFHGASFAAPMNVSGELVFNTSMSGYEEVLTDPSYAGQIIVFTYPHIGNTGINFQDHESQHVYAKGVIVRDYIEHYSNHRAKMCLASWLKQKKIPAITGIDTRALTQLIRDHGSGQADIDIESTHQALPYQEPKFLDTEKLYQVGSKNKKPIVVVDMGMKHSILVQLQQYDHPIYLVPPTTSLAVIQKYHPCAIVLSNGPGDPQSYPEAIRLARQCAEISLPMYGICLGCQIIALALGGRVDKLKFGHHGSNHPVQDLKTKGVYITSQNHNYVVDEATLPEEFEVTYRSLFDNTIQGIRHRHKPIIAWQGHPEAGPGPLDMQHIFRELEIGV